MQRYEMLDALSEMSSCLNVARTMGNDVWNKCFDTEEPKIDEYRQNYEWLMTVVQVEGAYLRKMKELIENMQKMLGGGKA